MNSAWVLSDGYYVRFPRGGTLDPRRPEGSTGRLQDNVWYELRAAWWGVDSSGSLRLRILPRVGPEHGKGIVTSPVLQVIGCRLSAALTEFLRPREESNGG